MTSVRITRRRLSMEGKDERVLIVATIPISFTFHRY
jgi:hypothetical protein